MNHRERILTALSHEEPDRVPIDFGGTVDSTISAQLYQALRQELGLAPSHTSVLDVFQQTAVIEDDVRRSLAVDTAPMFYRCEEWRDGLLGDGSPARLPARFITEIEEDGAQVVVNASGIVTAVMPAGGYYFDPVYAALANATGVDDLEQCAGDIETYDKPDHLDTSYAVLAAEAKALREQSDRAVVGYFGGHILQACQILRGWETFLMDMLVNRKLAEALIDRLHESNMRQFERYAETVGKYIDVIHLEEDLGMQDRLLMRPEPYRELLKPRQMEFFRFVKSRCNAVILFHTDGAVADLIPDFIEMGVDALNPVQVSAAGMDPAELKKEFGGDIAFWGAGCDSQSVLAFGTPQEVADEVKRHIDTLAPGGGYIFSPIHNIQVDVPPANAVAMFDAALEYGVY